MKRRARLVTALTTGTAALVAIGLTAPGADASAQDHSARHHSIRRHTSRHHSIRHDTAATGLPTQVFAPYFEAYNTSDGGPSAQSQASGAKYLSLAFLQTATAGSCTVYWNGDTSEPVSSSSFGSDISAIQAAGGNVIPSFGGESADTTGTELADSCTNVSDIAGVYENVISTYHVSRIDLDVEGDSLTNTAGINRRNEAITQVESWAAANGITIQFSYTMPASTTGMTSQDEAVIENAIADHAQISTVNLMTFDYYTGTEQNMATDTETAATGAESQLQSLFPSDTSAQLWHMIGVTEMPGIDDAGSDETFTEADATTILTWAKSKGISTLSFWALQRDNGGCPGTAGSDTCSGITQTTWYFSHAFENFTAQAQWANDVPFQANSGHLLIYKPQNNSHVDSNLGMKAGTSPSVASSGGGYEVAFQVNTGDLFTYNPQNNTHVNSNLGMKAGTSPSVASSGGGYEVAFQANTGDLFTYNPQNNTHVNSNLGMKAGTSPSVASSGGGYEVAFQANTGDLFTYNLQNNTHVNSNLGMKAGTSPSVASSGGGYEVAFQANTGHLFTYNPQNNTHVDTGLGMAAGTSPSIVALPSGGYEVAFQANTGDLFTYNPQNNTHVDTGLGMAAGTSPSVVALPSSDYGVAYQASTGDLFTYDFKYDSDVDSGLGMETATSPAIG